MSYRLDHAGGLADGRVPSAKLCRSDSIGPHSGASCSASHTHATVVINPGRAVASSCQLLDAYEAFGYESCTFLPNIAGYSRLSETRGRDQAAIRITG
jgi:hypothetical protein